MAELRLSKLIKHFNVGLRDLVDYLQTLGVEVDFNPNTKVSDEYLPALEKEFGSLRKLKEQAEKVDVRFSDILEKAAKEKAKREAEEKANIRVNKLMRQFSVGLAPLVAFLNEQGANIEMHPNAKVPVSYLPAIKEKFGSQDNHVETMPEMNKSLSASVAPEEFDWDAFENGVREIEVPEIQHIPPLSKIVENEVVEGVVTSINKREVVVNIGGHKEGVISAPEFRYNPDLKVGDKVEVLVESAEDRKGQLIISHKKARARKAWDMVNAAYDNNEIVKGYIKTRTKGGMIVDVFGIEAFLPGSQVDIKPIREYDIYVNTTMDFKIVKINQEFRNVVVSHKAIIEEDKAAFISQLKKGQILEGTVKSIVDYGIFVELGIADGLIHINDLRKETSKQPNEVASVGDKVKVVILDVNRDLQRVALGLKQDTEKPRNNGPAASTTTDVFRPESIFNAKALEMLKKQNED